MKTAFISLTTSLLVTISLLIGLGEFQGTGELESLSARTVELEKAKATTTLSITNLYSEFGDIRSQLRQGANSDNSGSTDLPKADIGFDELSNRVELLENVIHELSLRELPVSKTIDSGGYRKQVTQGDHQSSEMSNFQRSALAEREFDSDSGVPLGEYADSVAEGVHENSSIEVQGLECRSSICKVTFSAKDPSNAELEDGKTEMIDELISRANGKEVEIRYVNDEYGNSVMYVQLH